MNKFVNDRLVKNFVGPLCVASLSPITALAYYHENEEMLETSSSKWDEKVSRSSIVVSLFFRLTQTVIKQKHSNA